MRIIFLWDLKYIFAGLSILKDSSQHQSVQSNVSYTKLKGTTRSRILKEGGKFRVMIRQDKVQIAGLAKEYELSNVKIFTP
jgi:hypothetical protein